jgi:hypothetical protein
MDLRGAKKQARRGSGVARPMPRTQFFTLVTEALFTSTVIKRQLSSVPMKPIAPFSPTHGNSVSRREKQ